LPDIKATKMTEEDFSPEQSLKLISNMIAQAKARFSENGHLYLLWGWTVFICSIAQFILFKYIKFEQHYLVWTAVWLILIYQVFYLRRQKSRLKVRGYADRIIAAVWITFSVMMFLFGFLFGKLLGEQYYQFISPGFLALYGMPTVLSGTILQFRPLVFGGICCWVLSICSVFVPYEYSLLMLAAAVVVAWIIPGYLMRIKYRKSQ
jgi:hypothetical protein